MIDPKTSTDFMSGPRARTRQSSAYVLRQHAIKIGGDLEGWRLARRMRDAETLHQVTAVERELGRYLQRHPLELPRVA